MMYEFLKTKVGDLSEYKITPRCKHFGLCGGCSLQDLHYQKQLEIKKEWLLFCLNKENLQESEKVLDPLQPSPSLYFYRNKMEFAFGIENHRIILGLREPSITNKTPKKKVISLEECPIFSQNIKEIFSRILDFVNIRKLSVYDPYRKNGFLRHLVLREAKTTGEMMLCIVTKNEDQIRIEDITNHLSSLKQIKSIYWVKNDAISDVVKYENKKLLYGKPFIEENIDSLTFRIYPEIFFQTNTEATQILYQKVITNIEGAEKILGLYCGSGAMELYVSKKAAQIIGVDWDPYNIKTAIENTVINDIKNASFLCERTERISKVLETKKFDYLIVDPPRSGLTSKAIKQILELNFKNLIYVSCNPISFAKDLRVLKENNFKIKKLYAFDFTPHILHLEIMGILHRGDL